MNTGQLKLKALADHAREEIKKRIIDKYRPNEAQNIIKTLGL